MPKSQIIVKAIANANAYKNFVENLMVATSKYIFRFRAYESKAPNVLRDSQEYGQLIQNHLKKLDVFILLKD